ncbi:MAG: hypothetical protein QM639_04490 [Rhodocyclaceae bacterium]
MAEVMKIDLGNYEGPLFTGRPRGKAIREKLELDKLDDGVNTFVVDVPQSAFSVTSSFFLGLFGPSVIKAGTPETFFNRFEFRAPPVLRAAFADYVERALQGRSFFQHM